MAKHPYETQPPYAFWRRAIERVPLADVDPVVEAGFTLLSSEKVATAGSCFAQHIARHLRGVGFNVLITEDAHPIVQDFASPAYNYSVYTARYGNIYTARQLLQLFHRAYDTFAPVDDVWLREDGRLVDPFRPQIQPEGYHTVEELHADRAHHLACVRRAFEELNVFVFTLGLTEGWISKKDGAVFPICPGVAGGSFDPGKYALTNFRVRDVVADMTQFIVHLRTVNPKAKVLLTVSPVPLVATAENRHVLVSTTYSKSALRAACEEIVAGQPEVYYFPSYEIIAGNFNLGRYYASDLRSVTEEGVEHVMKLFIKYYTNAAPSIATSHAQETSRIERDFEKVIGVICDEEALDH